MSESIEKLPIEVLREAISGVDVFNVDYRYELGKIHDALVYSKSVFTPDEFERVRKIADIAGILDSTFKPTTTDVEMSQNTDKCIGYARALPQGSLYEGGDDNIKSIVKDIIEKIVRNTLFQILVRRFSHEVSFRPEAMTQLIEIVRGVICDEGTAKALDEISEIMNKLKEGNIDSRSRNELLVQKAELVGRLPRDYGFRDKIALFTSIPEELGAVKEAVKLSGGSVSGI